MPFSNIVQDMLILLFENDITLSEQVQSPIEKYHTVGTGPKSNRKIVERGKIDNPNTQIHDRSLS